MARGTRLFLPVAAAILVAGGVGLFFHFRLPRAVPDEIRAAIGRMDQAIAGGYFSTALDELDRLPALPSDEGTLLSLAKRAFQVSGASGDYAPLARFMERALAANGSSPRLRLIGAYADLRSGRLAMAQRLVREGLSPRDLGEGIRAEAALRGGQAWNGSDPLARQLLGLEANANPAAFVQAAASTGDARLTLDAALLEMGAGAGSQAQMAARALPDGPAFDEPAALIDYDVGAAGAAVTRIQRALVDRPSAERELLLADALHAAGAPVRAEAALAAAVASQPDLTWTAYANLAYLAAARGALADAARRVAEGLTALPDSQELAVAAARVRVQAGDRQGAAAALSALVEAHPQNVPAAFLLLELRSPAMSPGSYRASLWKLFDRAPYDGRTYAALLQALVSAQDWAGAAIAVRQHRLATDQTDTATLELEGLVAAMRDDLPSAVASLKAAVGLAADAAARYDLALVLLKEGNTAEARAQLSQAQQEASSVADPARRMRLASRIAAALGMTRVADGDLSGGHADLVRSVSLDPSNLRARLLVMNLEPGGQQ
ncbi:MAG TPA: hypothetical protein VFH83_06520 [Spirochaetia bacterium]|nr:hypothetical protein [Spirochaetia bacterium]